MDFHGLLESQEDDFHYPFPSGMKSNIQRLPLLFTQMVAQTFPGNPLSTMVPVNVGLASLKQVDSTFVFRQQNKPNTKKVPTGICWDKKIKILAIVSLSICFILL